MSAITINKENFTKEVMESEKPILLDFWAAWCNPCKMISPIIEEIAVELSDKVKVGKVNIDEEPELASTFKVMSIPSLFVVKDGKVISTGVGVKPKNEILEMLNI